MKTILTLLGCAALLAPLPAAAQSHHHDSGHWSGNHWQGGHWTGDHFHGHWERRAWGHYPYAYDGFGLGFGLGAALAYPWRYDYPADYYSYYNYYGAYDEADPPPYYGYDDNMTDERDWDDKPLPQTQAPSPRRSAQVCGSWSWDADAQRYNWIPCS